MLGSCFMARIWVLFGVLGVVVAWQTGVFSPLCTAVQAGKQSDGTYLLPTSQILRPWGFQTPITGRPVDMRSTGKEESWPF